MTKTMLAMAVVLALTSTSGWADEAKKTGKVEGGVVAGGPPRAPARRAKRGVGAARSPRSSAGAARAESNGAADPDDLRWLHGDEGFWEYDLARVERRHPRR